MKKVQLASFLLLVLTLLVMAVNRFAAVLPDCLLVVMRRTPNAARLP